MSIHSQIVSVSFQNSLYSEVQGNASDGDIHIHIDPAEKLPSDAIVREIANQRFKLEEENVLLEMVDKDWEGALSGKNTESQELSDCEQYNYLGWSLLATSMPAAGLALWQSSMPIFLTATFVASIGGAILLNNRQADLLAQSRLFNAKF